MDLSTKATFGRRRRLELTLNDALAVVIAFCWSLQDLTKPYGPENSYKWAYHVYDTVLHDVPDQLMASTLAANGLNAGITAKTMLLIEAKVRAGLLPDLGGLVPFWEMDPFKLNNDPRDTSPEGLMWTWYREMTGIEGVGGAVSSKIGHHSFPNAMCLWDSVVGKFWSASDMWGEFAQNLKDEKEWLEELERLFESYRVNSQAADGVALNRSRLVDILVWGEGSGDFTYLLRDGLTLLSTTTPPGTW